MRLDAPELGLHIPPLIWAVQYKYSADAVLLVLASDHYDPADYIRDYDEFLSRRPQRRERPPSKAVDDLTMNGGRWRAFCSASQRYCPVMPRPSAVSPPKKVITSISGV